MILDCEPNVENPSEQYQFAERLRNVGKLSMHLSIKSMNPSANSWIYTSMGPYHVLEVLLTGEFVSS